MVVPWEIALLTLSWGMTDILGPTIHPLSPISDHVTLSGKSHLSPLHNKMARLATIVRVWPAGGTKSS